MNWRSGWAEIHRAALLYTVLCVSKQTTHTERTWYLVLDYINFLNNCFIFLSHTLCSGTVSIQPLTFFTLCYILRHWPLTSFFSYLSLSIVNYFLEQSNTVCGNTNPWPENLDNPFKQYKAGSWFNKTQLQIFLQKEEYKCMFKGVVAWHWKTQCV